MTHINRLFFTDISLKIKTVIMAMLLLFALSHQKTTQFIHT